MIKHRLLSKSARSAPKILDMGGDQWVDGGGLRIFLMGGDRPPWGGGQGSDVGGLARDSQQNSEVSQISK